MTQKVAVTESETLFKDWKALTELEGEFGAVNARLRDIFAVASKVGRDSAADSTPSVTSKVPPPIAAVADPRSVWPPVAITTTGTVMEHAVKPSSVAAADTAINRDILPLCFL